MGIKTIQAECGKTLCIGRKGENRTRQVIFDLSHWRMIYGPGTAQLIVQRQGEETPYPAALTVSGNTATWVITAADTAIPGAWGKAELRYMAGDTLAKSETWRTVVADALGEPTETPPEPQQGWVDQVLAAGARVQADAQQAVQAIQSEGQAQLEQITAEGAAQVAAAKAQADRAETAAGDASDSARAAEQAQQEAENAKEAAGQSAGDAANSARASQEAEKRAKAAAVHQPYPNPETGTWWAWSIETGEYIDTGLVYTGNVMYGTFDVDPATGRLTMTVPDRYSGPMFALNENGELEVSINA